MSIFDKDVNGLLLAEIRLQIRMKIIEEEWIRFKGYYWVLTQNLE